MDPEQLKTLNTFTGQRDALLRDITILRGQFAEVEAKTLQAEEAAREAMERKIQIDAVIQAKLEVINEIINPLVDRIKELGKAAPMNTRIKEPGNFESPARPDRKVIDTARQESFKSAIGKKVEEPNQE